MIFLDLLDFSKLLRLLLKIMKVTTKHQKWHFTCCTRNRSGLYLLVVIKSYIRYKDFLLCPPPSGSGRPYGFLKKNLNRSFLIESQSRTFTGSFTGSFLREKNLHRFLFWFFSGVKNLPWSISRSISESQIVAQRFHF